jgi:hypothetical protein
LNARTAILATALAFICALAGLTIAAVVRDGVSVLTFVSVLVLALLGCGVAGALLGGSPED